MSQTQSNGYRAVFRNGSFRNFWVGISISILGDGISRVALTWYVYQTTGAPEALALLNLLYTGPVVVGGLLAGWLLDRFGARRVLVWDSVLRGVVMLAIPLLNAFGLLSLWHIYVAATVHGFLLMVPLAGGPTLVPRLVSSEQLPTANALELLSFTLGGIAGPPLAGWLIGQIGGPNAICLDSLSFFVFALLLAGVHPAPLAAPNQPGGARYGLADAFRLLRGNAVLLTTTLMFMAVNLGSGILGVLLPVYASRDLGGGPELYGLLLGAMAVGEMASSALVGARAFPLPLGLLICLAQMLTGGAIALLLAAINPWWTWFCLLLIGACSAPLTIWAQTLRMRIIPAELRGRTFALLRMLMQGGGPLGAVIAGVALPALGIPVLMAVSALTVAVPGFLGTRVARMRHAASD
ncbi:MAG: MFS transporter [Chloroflexi bacterium]|nr:MFS transporter [Chloroflexota bacterium]